MQDFLYRSALLRELAVIIEEKYADQDSGEVDNVCFHLTDFLPLKYKYPVLQKYV